jgi:hypothetical protein
MTTNRKLMLARLLAASPMFLALLLLIFGVMSAPAPVIKASVMINKTHSLSDLLLAYERSSDKENFLAKVYDDIKGIKEEGLPPDLLAFVVKVKVSQFCK